MYLMIERRKYGWYCGRRHNGDTYKHMEQAVDHAWQQILQCPSDTFYIRTAPTRSPCRLFIQDADPLDSPYLFQSTSKREARNDLVITLQMLNEDQS